MWCTLFAWTSDGLGQALIILPDPSADIGPRADQADLLHILDEIRMAVKQRYQLDRRAARLDEDVNSRPTATPFSRSNFGKRGFWSEVQQVYEKRICTSLPSSLRIAWTGVLKPRHFLGVRLVARTMSWISSPDTVAMSI